MPGKKTGDAGERIAAEYLRLNGYRILERNYRAGRLEIDLVAAKGSCLAFVEVKIRLGASFGCASESVGRRKLGHMKSAALSYLNDPGMREFYDEIRFDLVAIDVDEARDRLELRHLKGIV